MGTLSRLFGVLEACGFLLSKGTVTPGFSEVLFLSGAGETCLQSPLMHMADVPL